MFSDAIKQIQTAFTLLLLFILLTGLIYPSMVTGIAQLLFPWKANGSLLQYSGENTGSLLIGQSFTDPKYFWGRPSATSPFPNNAESSSGSNFGPSNPDFLKIVKERVENIRHFDPENTFLIPVDLVTASGSGLDPEISPYAAFYQVPRIAKYRHISEENLQALIERFTKNRSLGFLGEPRINVLELNIALDNLEKK